MIKVFGNFSNSQKFKKLIIDELQEKSKDDSDSLTDEICKIVRKDFLNQSDNISDSEMDEKIHFNKGPREFPTTLNSINITRSLSLGYSNLSIQSDKTAATSLEIHSRNNLNAKSKNIALFDVEDSYENKKIDIINIISGLNTKTMLEINNIPKEYNLYNFREELNNNGFKDKFNYLIFESKDRYVDNDVSENKNVNYEFNEDKKCYRKAFINFTDPLHIIVFYELYQNKFFDIKGQKCINIFYSEHKPGRKINLISEIKNNNINNNKVYINQVTIDIPLKYLDIFKKYKPNDRYSFSLSKKYDIETFIVKKDYK